jgi:type IV secretory pathway TrbF-like protein
VNRPFKSAKEFVDDIRSGMPDPDLQQKYSLSRDLFFIYKAAALDFLAKHKDGSRPKRKINARQILADIKNGMSDDTIMTKYGLSARQLQSVFRQIIQAGLATALELSSRLSITKSQVREAFEETGRAIRELD